MTTAQDQQSRAEPATFEAWWAKEGQFCRAGGGDYEKTFAHSAWQAASTLPEIAEPVAHLHLSRERENSMIWFTDKPKAGTEPVYTAAQVQAMGRVPPGWQAVPVEADAAIIDALAGPGRVLPAYVGAKEKSDARLGDRWRDALAAAPSPPAAQKRYRLLVRNVDTIQADDEFLRDADSTWRIDPCGIFVGMPYMSNVLLPARRAIEPTP